MGGKTNLKTSLIMAVLLVGMVLVVNTNVCKGDDAYMVLDDMEDYDDRDDIRQVWRDGNADVVWEGSFPYLTLVRGGSSGSNLNVSSAVGSPLQGNTGPIHGGDQAMVLRYDNDGWTYTGLPGDEKWIYDAPYFSEIEANTVGINSLDVGQNWDSEGVKSLSLSFQGHPISDGYYDASLWPTYTVSGRGRDIWGRHDEFYLFSKYPFIGNGSVQVRVLNVDNTDPWAKAGVIIREKWAPYSRYAAVFITPGQGVTFQWRDVEDGPTTTITKPGVSAPEYVRLVRNIDSTFEAKHSETGFVWEDVNAPGSAPVFPAVLMGSISDPNLYAGSAVTSHNANQICAADFNNVLISPLPPNWIFGNIGTNSAEQLYVALSDGTNTSVVEHDDPNAATLTEWQEWNIPLTAFTGVDFNSIKKVYIGLGDRAAPVYGGSGTVYIDDIRLIGGSPLLFVDAGAQAGGDGSSWANAYKYLQDALAAASSDNEIRVAEGTYKPDQGGGQTLGDQTTTFQLINDVTIYGGYAGLGEPDPNARDIKLYKTILSGDLNGDDGPDFANNDENSYHVVTGSGTESSAILDGFTITAGNANGSNPNNKGGGMWNDSGSPTVTNCTFSGNSAGVNGGGMYNTWSSPTLTNCTFSGNSADEGGGMANENGGYAHVRNCTFSGNSAVQGGGMSNYWGSSPFVTNCTFSGNSAWDGGGMYNSSSAPLMTNCTFSGNSAGNYGFGIYNNSSGTPHVTNCIFWGNTNPGELQIYNESSMYKATVSYSDVEHGYNGTGNIYANPLFIDADGPDDIVGTEDDNLRLSSGSPCIDAGDNNSVPADMADLDGDGDTSEPTPFDLEGNPRLFDDPITADTGYPPWADAIVDMGAYEFYDHLVAHWKLNEKGGTMAWDSSGNGHDGTAQSDPDWVDGPPGYGRAMYFDGNDPAPAWVNCGTWNPSAQTGQLTVATWVQWDGPNGRYQGLIGKSDSWDDQGTQMMWLLEIDRDGHNVRFQRGGSYPWCGGIVLPEGEWSHVAATFDGTTLIFYVDGAETGRGDFSFGAKTNATIVFGATYLSGINGFNGALDDVRLYNYALSADEIRWLLCARPPRGDLNRDCRVDFVDFAILASGWLDCGLMVQELCGQ